VTFGALAGAFLQRGYPVAGAQRGGRACEPKPRLGRGRLGHVSLGTLLLVVFLIGCALAIVGFVVGVQALELPGLVLVVVSGIGQVFVGPASR
jgi:hypothetical protein